MNAGRLTCITETDSLSRAGMELVGLPEARIKELTRELKNLLKTHHEEEAK